MPSCDGRRLDLYITGLPISGGVPLLVDASIVSPLHADGTVWEGADSLDGASLQRVLEAKQRTYPEFSRSTHNDHGKLLILACEVGGRFNSDSLWIVKALVDAKVRGVHPHLRRSAAYIWFRRWWGMLSVALQRTCSETIFSTSSLPFAGGDVGPDHEFVNLESLWCASSSSPGCVGGSQDVQRDDQQRRTSTTRAANS